MGRLNELFTCNISKLIGINEYLVRKLCKDEKERLMVQKWNVKSNVYLDRYNNHEGENERW